MTLRVRSNIAVAEACGAGMLSPARVLSCTVCLLAALLGKNNADAGSMHVLPYSAICSACSPVSLRNSAVTRLRCHTCCYYWN